MPTRNQKNTPSLSAQVFDIVLVRHHVTFKVRLLQRVDGSPEWRLFIYNYYC